MLQPLTPEMKLLESIPGIDTVSAATILGEIGTDMKQFQQRHTWHPGLAFFRGIKCRHC